MKRATFGRSLRLAPVDTTRTSRGRFCCCCCNLCLLPTQASLSTSGRRATFSASSSSSLFRGTSSSPFFLLPPPLLLRPERCFPRRPTTAASHIGGGGGRPLTSYTSFHRSPNHHDVNQLLTRCRQAFLASKEEEEEGPEKTKKEKQKDSDALKTLTLRSAAHPNYFYHLLLLLRQQLSNSLLSSSSSLSSLSIPQNERREEEERVEALLALMLHPKVFTTSNNNAFLCSQLIQLLREDAEKSKADEEASKRRRRSRRRWEQSLAVWEAMKQNNIQRDTFLYTHLLQSASPLLQQLHDKQTRRIEKKKQLEEEEQEMENVLQNVKQVYAYMKEEEREEAGEKEKEKTTNKKGRSSFKSNVQVWNVLLDLLVKSGRWEEAHQLFVQQRQENEEAEKKNEKLYPNEVSYGIIIRGCPNREEAVRWIEELIRLRRVNIQHCNTFLQTLSRLYSSLGSERKAGEDQESLMMFDFYHRMKKSKEDKDADAVLPPPNSYTFSILLSHCANNIEHLLPQGEQLLEQTILPLLSGSSSNGQQFGVLYGSILNFYAKKGDHETALRWFRRMVEEGGKPNLIHFNTLLSSCINFVNPTIQRRSNTYSFSSSVASLEREQQGKEKQSAKEMMEQMEALREEIKQRWRLKEDAVTFNILILAAGKLAKDHNKAWSLFREMTQHYKLQPTTITFGSLFNAVATSFASFFSHSASSSEEGRRRIIRMAEEEMVRVLNEMNNGEGGQCSHHIFFNDVLDFYGRVGSVQQCRHLLRALLLRCSLATQHLFAGSVLETKREDDAEEQSDLITQLLYNSAEEKRDDKEALDGNHLNSFIEACLINQRFEEAEEILQIMRRAASTSSPSTTNLLAPDVKSFVTFLSYCLDREEEKSRGRRVLQWMREDGLMPATKTNAYATEIIRRLEEE
ncbi:hypothetical protein QOT17_011803 [Balamuthia mandrillaris]